MNAAFLLARVLVATERFDEAEATLSSLVLAHTHVKALRLMASLQYQRTAFGACESTLERLTGLRPVQATIEEFQRLAKLKQRSRNADEARSVIRQAMDLYPGNVDATHADILADRNQACMVKRTGRPMWILDADLRILRDPRPVTASLSGFDLAIGSNPCAFEPILKFMACCVGLAPTPRGLAFARRVGAYILHMKNTGAWGWGVDQTALFSTYAYMDEIGDAPVTRFLDSSAISLNTDASGAFQFPSGINKYYS